MSLRPFVLGRAALGLVAFVPAMLRAQEPSPPAPPITVPSAALPTRAAVQLAIAGPAVWRAQFAPTNVGSLLASESGQVLARTWLVPMAAAVQQMLGADDATWAAIRARLLDYSGTLEVAIDRLDDDTAPTLRLWLGPDGRTDLSVLAADLTLLAARLSGQSWQAGDAAAGARVLALGNAVFLSEPSQRDGLLAVIAPRQRVGPALAAAQARAGDRPPRDRTRPQPAFALRVDVAAIVAAKVTAPDEAAMQHAFGVDALDQFELTIGTAGPHVQIECAQTFARDDRGLFSVLFPAAAGLPAIAALRPAAGASYKAGHLDLVLIRDLVIAALADGRPGAEAEVRAKIESDIEPWLGTRESGILTQLTGEYLLVGATDPLVGGAGGGADWVVALGVRDDAAFAAQWRAVRKDLGFTGLGDEDLGDGFRVQSIGGFVRLSALTGPGLFALGYGPGVREQFDALVTAARRGPWRSPQQPPAAVQSLLRHAPSGLNGFGEGQIATLLTELDVGVRMIEELVGHLAGFERLRSMEVDERRQVEYLLGEHQLQTARSLTGYADRRWCFRVLW